MNKKFTDFIEAKIEFLLRKQNQIDSIKLLIELYLDVGLTVTTPLTE